MILLTSSIGCPDRSTEEHLVGHLNTPLNIRIRQERFPHHHPPNQPRDVFLDFGYGIQSIKTQTDLTTLVTLSVYFPFRAEVTSLPRREDGSCPENEKPVRCRSFITSNTMSAVIILFCSANPYTNAVSQITFMRRGTPHV